MNNITKKIDIDLYSPASYEVVRAQQGDNISRIIEFSLYNQGEPYIIPVDAAIKMEGHRGDNSSFIKENCTVSNNCISATIDSDILYASGTVEAKIVLYDPSNDAILSTIPFKIHVQKNPCDKSKIESNKHSVIDWIVLGLEKIKSKLKEVEKSISDEIARATGKENEIAINLSTETNRAMTSENMLRSNLDGEISRATNAENNLNEKKANLSSPALTGTPTAPTASTGTNTTQIATTAFVQAAVSDGIAASDALIFKGTIGAQGTVTQLPTLYKTGWTYRVISEGTYAGEICEIGDLIVALVDRNGSGNLDSDWCVAQTNINGAITGIRGDNTFLSCSQSGSTVTISHKDISRSDSSSSTSLTHGDSFLAVKSVTSDQKGHITGIHTETFTLPAISSTDAVHLQVPRTVESPSDQTGHPIASFTVEEFAPVGDALPELPSGNYYHIYTAQSADSNYATQLAVGMTTSDLAYRRKHAGVWGEWNLLIYSGNIGQQSVKRANIASGIQSMQVDGVTDYPEGNYLIRSMFNGTGFKLVCKNNNSDVHSYGVIVDHSAKAESLSDSFMFREQKTLATSSSGSWYRLGYLTASQIYGEFTVYSLWNNNPSSVTKFIVAGGVGVTSNDSLKITEIFSTWGKTEEIKNKRICKARVVYYPLASINYNIYVDVFLRSPYSPYTGSNPDRWNYSLVRNGVFEGVVGNANWINESFGDASIPSGYTSKEFSFL